MPTGLIGGAQRPPAVFMPAPAPHTIGACVGQHRAGVWIMAADTCVSHDAMRVCACARLHTDVLRQDRSCRRVPCGKTPRDAGDKGRRRRPPLHLVQVADGNGRKLKGFQPLQRVKKVETVVVNFNFVSVTFGLDSEVPINHPVLLQHLNPEVPLNHPDDTIYECQTQLYFLKVAENVLDNPLLDNISLTQGAQIVISSGDVSIHQLEKLSQKFGGRLTTLDISHCHCKVPIHNVLSVFPKLKVFHYAKLYKGWAQDLLKVGKTDLRTVNAVEIVGDNGLSFTASDICKILKKNCNVNIRCHLPKGNNPDDILLEVTQELKPLVKAPLVYSNIALFSVNCGGKPFKMCLPQREELKRKADSYINGTKRNAQSIIFKGSDEICEDESSCQVTVSDAKPAFKKGLGDQAVPKGAPLRLEIEVDGKPKSVKWYKNGDELKPSGKAKPEDLGNGQYALVIPAVDAEDFANYTVKVSNDAGEVESSAKVTEAPSGKPSAGDKPQIVSGLKPQTVKPGDRVVLEVEVAGPVKQVKWYKNGQELPDAQIEEFNGKKYRLILPSASGNDAGDYKVVLSNDDGTADSFAALTVTLPVDAGDKKPAGPALKFVKPLKDVTADKGATVPLEIELSKKQKQVDTKDDDAEFFRCRECGILLNRMGRLFKRDYAKKRFRLSDTTWTAQRAIDYIQESCDKMYVNHKAEAKNECTRILQNGRIMDLVNALNDLQNQRLICRNVFNLCDRHDMWLGAEEIREYDKEEILYKH